MGLNAQRLMQAVRDEARAVRASAVWLGVWEHNPRAIAFYRKEIFTLTGRTPGEGKLGERAEAVAKALARHAAFLKDEVLPRSTDAWRIGPELFADRWDWAP